MAWHWACNPKREIHGLIWWCFAQNTVSETKIGNLHPWVRRRASLPLSDAESSPSRAWNKHGFPCLLLPSGDLAICMDIERNPGPPYSLLNAHLSAVIFDYMPARHSFSTTSNGLVNDFARKVYTRELFSIRSQSNRWSNNFLYYRLKSLGIFKYRSRRSSYSSKFFSTIGQPGFFKTPYKQPV